MKQRLLLTTFLVVFCVSGFAQQANRQNPSCASFPCIVASISLVNQSMSVSQAPIYTPTTSGVFVLPTISKPTLRLWGVLGS